MDFLTTEEAERLVDSYLQRESSAVTTQELLDSGDVPRLKGYIVRPGKVSDSIFGGPGSFSVDMEKEPAHDSILTGKRYEKKNFVATEKGKDVPKVRYIFENPPLSDKEGVPLRLMVRTRRISTHDINRGEIPFKDQILAANHNFMRRLVMDLLGTSQYDVGLPDNSIVIAAENLRPILFENVLRAYAARTDTSTSLFVAYFVKGLRSFCGHQLPEGLVPNGPLSYIMDTPSTKSDERDESLSPQELVERGICTEEQYDFINRKSVGAQVKAARFLRNRGITLVDDKKEQGINSRGETVSQDELFTLDSSRFWLTDDYNTQLKYFSEGMEQELVGYLKATQPGIKEADYTWNGRVAITPRSYSKEFARGFSAGEQGYTGEQIRQIAIRYIQGIQHLLGQRFEPDMRPWEERAITGLRRAVNELAA